MRKASWITLILAALAALGCFFLGEPVYGAAIWIGAFWGIGNFWVIGQTTRGLFSAQKRWHLVVWLLVKFVGFYGLMIWFLVGVQIPALAFIGGFLLSLIGLGMGMFPSLKPFLSRTRHLLATLAMLGIGSIAWASETSQGQAAAAHPPEIPSLITVLTQFGEGPIVHFLHSWENTIYALILVGLVGGLIAFAARTVAFLPGRGQIAVEAVIESLDRMVSEVLGQREGRRYLPFVGTLFLYILVMNLAGLVPGLKSPTSRFEMTAALGACVFIFVQWTGIRRLGLLGYLDHLIGQPRDLMGWIFSPIMLFIHVIGEIVKPVSLSLRLFGNIMGEDTLLGVFVLLGALAMSWSHLPLGLPLHFPFVLLAILFSFVQALVFTMLSAIYISMMLPHEEPKGLEAHSQGH